MNIPSTYLPKPVTPKKNEADKSLDKARAEVEGQKRALKRMVR